MKTTTVLLMMLWGIIFSATATADELHAQTDSVYIVGGSEKTNSGNNQTESASTIQYGMNIAYKAGTSIRLLYNNEGHPDYPVRLGHRDGFAGLFVLPLYTISGGTVIDWGIGPYFTMNTIVKDGSQKNEKALGLMMAFSLRYPLSSSTNAVFSISDVSNMPGQFSSRAYLVGLEYRFSPEKHRISSVNDLKYHTSLWVGSSSTTRSDGRAHQSIQIEVLQTIPDTNTAYSVSGLSEGRGQISDRNGVAGQFWYRLPVTHMIQVGAGIGPYVAYEKNEQDRGWRGLAIITARITVKITDSFSLGVQFNRLPSRYDKDQDMFGLSFSGLF